MTPKQVTVHGNTRWEVDFGLDISGHRKRSFFPTDTEASKAIDDYEADVKKFGEYWARLSPLKRQIVVSSLQDIEARGQTIQSVWADWQRWSAENSITCTISKTYEEVLKEHITRQLGAGRSAKYMDEADRYVYQKFGAGRMQQNFHEIPVGHLQAWIAAQKWGLSSKRTNTSLFSALWETGKDLGYCSINICDRLASIGKISRVVEIYPNNTCMNLLAASLSNPETEKVLILLVLGLFGCMRPEESEHALMGWNFISTKNKQISLGGDITKTGDQRVIRCQPTAVEWLKLCEKLKCPLPAVNARRLIDQCCELIGLDDWIRDGLRKDCATHLRTIYKLDYEVVKDMGNSVRIMLRHYADLHVPEEVSVDYWNITPERVRKYMKTDAWLKVIADAEARRQRKANETATPAN